MKHAAQRPSRLLLWGACGLLAGCAAPQGTPISALLFAPEPQATRSAGSFPDRTLVAQAVPGVGKAQLFQWFGPPHFGEDPVAAPAWDYIFHFRSGGGITRCRCKVIFDQAGVAQRFQWQPAACGDWLTVTTPVQAQGTAAP